MPRTALPVEELAATAAQTALAAVAARRGLCAGQATQARPRASAAALQGLAGAPPQRLGWQAGRGARRLLLERQVCACEQAARFAYALLALTDLLHSSRAWAC